MKKSKSLWLQSAAITLITLSSICIVPGAENDNKKADPTGTWKWSFETQSGQTISSSVKLKTEDGKLTGAFMGRGGNETPIQDGKIKGDEISFSVVRERNGQQMTVKYEGKISGDTIKGKSEMERNGETRSRDWEAKRELANATGTWKWSFDIPNGPTFEPSAKLTQEGEKLTGVLRMGDQERPISEGTVKNGEVRFKVLSKRDDRTVTSNYHGRLSGDTIKGKWDSDWTGDVVTRDWEAKRSTE
jgi:hypothetical protein